MSAKTYDYLALVRVSNMYKPRAGLNRHELDLVFMLVNKALKVWAYMDEGEKAAVDPRFRPGESEGP